MSRDQQESNLRQRAEAVAGKETEDISKLTAEEILTMVHDLNVHQIELEMQNDQLKLTEKELRDSRNSFVNLFENAPVGYVRLDDKGWILQSNQTMQTILGYSAAELNGKYLAHFVYAEDLGIFNGRYKAFFNRPENKTLAFRLTKKNADIIDVEIRGRLVENKLFQGNKDSISNCMLVNIVEISQRNVDENLKLAATVFEHSEEGIMIVDPDNKIMNVNSSFTAVTGYKANEVIGKSPRILKSGRQSKEFYQDMWQQIKRHGHWHGEVWNRRKNGDIYAEWLSITCVQDMYGRVTHYIGIFSEKVTPKL